MGGAHRRGGVGREGGAGAGAGVEGRGRARAGPEGAEPQRREGEVGGDTQASTWLAVGAWGAQEAGCRRGPWDREVPTEPPSTAPPLGGVGRNAGGEDGSEMSEGHQVAGYYKCLEATRRR